MCIAAWIWQAHPYYPFLLVLNRDEYHERSDPYHLHRFPVDFFTFNSAGCGHFFTLILSDNSCSCVEIFWWC